MLIIGLIIIGVIITVSYILISNNADKKKPKKK